MKLVLSHLKDISNISWSLDIPLKDLGFDSLDTIDFIV